MPRAGDRFSPEQLAERFAQVPPMTEDESRFEAARCLYCFDAPCTRACPTAIDVPGFIRQILHRDVLGAARTILGANIFGGSCARVCPTEVLCEGACVDRVLSGGPIPIGRLQGLACDAAMAQEGSFFEAGKATGRRVAVVGSGPAGLSCAHELCRLGHQVVVFEASKFPGGLDTSAVAAYKIATRDVLAEIERICAIGIDLRLEHPISPAQVLELMTVQGFDAVFLAIGLGQPRHLGIEGEGLPGVGNAHEFIAQTRLGPFLDAEVGRQVIVIGGGNTAIDAATAARRLGADQVTIAYRRGEESLSAYAFEQALARQDGVRFEWFATPTRFVEQAGVLSAVEFLRGDTRFLIPADQVILALGQDPEDPWVRWVESMPAGFGKEGRVDVVSATKATMVPGLYAGGDCLRRGGEVVDAVQDGKLAAWGIDDYLSTL